MNITIPIESIEGHQFLLKLTDCTSVPIESKIEIVDIALTDTSHAAGINNAGTLNKIASILFHFLEENDVILYFYCSKDPIRTRTSREKISYQQYRSKLFCSMFYRITNTYGGLYVNKSIILRDSTYGDHYIHLISKIKYLEIINKLESHLFDLNK